MLIEFPTVFDSFHKVRSQYYKHFHRGRGGGWWVAMDWQGNQNFKVILAPHTTESSQINNDQFH